jgi:2,3-bisphosphoglycerate-independent phosphoglycerate mutase
MPAVFHRQDMNSTLGQVLAQAGYRQLRIAETEKYAHVTYFFNCGRDDPFANEERRLVPSPRDVATYDLKPEMSVYEVTDTLLTEWMSGAYDFVVCNLANLDMVGHTGIIPAAVSACEAVDACVGRIVEAVKARKGRLIMTADHGNAEEMLTPDNHPQTAHSKNPVALILVDETTSCTLRPGKLGDIAPTILSLWGLPVPEEMTGQNLAEL